MNHSQIVSYYSQEELTDVFISYAKHREVVGMFPNGSFSSRPSTLAYANDIITQVKKGVVEFHGSVERWSQPMAIRADNYGDLRIGFDLMLDLDCKQFEHGKIAAQLVSDFLDKYDVKNHSIKFSGNRGFHIGIPWESIPQSINFSSTASLYPDIARRVGYFVRHKIKEDLEKALLKKDSPEKLAELTGRELKDILTDTGINPFTVVDVDPVLISPRHLVRMPYSLNKKTYLASLPMKKSGLEDFTPEKAHPDKIKIENNYLTSGEENEADLLFVEALDWAAKTLKKSQPVPSAKKIGYEKKIPEQYFPPCVKTIANGLADGKKRAVFVLINFLSSLKWSWEEIEQYLEKWNQKNTPPLPLTYISGQIKYSKNRNKQVPPPNCTQEGYYLSMGVCTPDHFCRSRDNMKNPVKYPKRVMGKGKKRK